MPKGGYIGTLLRVNLTDESCKTEQLKDEWAEHYIGGEGLCARILWNEMKPGVDPFDPANKIIFASGPLQGTKCPSTSRLCVGTKSPLTNGFTRTFAGGDAGYEFKRSGFDAIIVEGKSEKPVYVWIKDSDVEIRNADFVWGMNTGDTQKYIKKATNSEAKILCIGPSGERLVRFACIITGIGAFGRGGAGAVMGSKNLKALSMRGKNEVKVARPDDFQAAVKETYKNFKRNKELARDWRQFGTVSMVDTIENAGHWPTKNWQRGTFPGSDDRLYSVPWRKEMVKKDHACISCPVFCRKITLAKDGLFVGHVSEGPEYEAVWSFGPQCGNLDPKAITAADRYCDELGVDTISCGNTIGFAMELYEKGIISKKDTEGIELTYGNTLAMVDMIRKIGYRSGFGNILAEGVKRASEMIGGGSEKYAMHVKGLELPGYDPRGQFGMGLNFATANRGACHEVGYTTIEEVCNKPNEGFWWDRKPIFPSRFSTEKQGELVFVKQNEYCVQNSAIACSFGMWGLGSVLDKLLTAATGLDFNFSSLFKTGERIFNLGRAFNIREGLARRDDKLPERFLTTPLEAGPSKGHVVELEPMLKDYYRIRDWNEETGVPTEKKLNELGLEDVAEELRKSGKF
jgi:aldehyde:ferredoxin oxidoreductase